MANTIERVLGWVALVALVLAIGALAITFVPGGQDWWAQITAPFANPSGKPTIDDAQAALDSGDAAGANKIAAQVVAADASDASVDNRAGNIAERAGDERAAAHDYAAGEAADDRNPWNFVALGELYAREGDYSQADTQLRAALSIVPDAQFLHYDLGTVELHEGLTQPALADFEAELKRTPDYQPALIGKAQALGLLGRPLEAAQARKLALAAPKPSPSTIAVPSPSPSVVASPSPAPSPSVKPSPAASPSPTPRPTASASPTPTAAPSKRPASPPPSPSPVVVAHRAVVARPAATPSLPSPTPTPGRLPLSIADLASEAKGYLFSVASDPNFTRALPFADPTQSIAQLKSAILKGSIEDVLSAGTAAMLSHHFALAQSAFTTATDEAPNDWRGPYLAGINAQQRGDQAAARIFFTQAASRGGQAPVYVSLAVADVAEGDDSGGLDAARHAQRIAPDFAPASFTAGMIDILLADVPSAENELAVAANASGAPDRTSYFLTTLREREGVSP